MQRVRIGLTGLAFVFVVVLLAAVFASQSAEEKPITPKLIEEQTAPSSAGQKEELKTKEAQPKEPLAELGVAPGGAETNSSAGSTGDPVGPGR